MKEMINICKHRETRKYSYLGAKKVNIYLVNYKGLTWEIVNVSAGQYEFTLHHHRGKIDFFAGSLHEALTMIIDWDILPRVSDMPRVLTREPIMRQLCEHNKENHQFNRFKISVNQEGEIEVTKKSN